MIRCSSDPPGEDDDDNEAHANDVLQRSMIEIEQDRSYTISRTTNDETVVRICTDTLYSHVREMPQP